jgi:hypothetical protein
LELILSISYKQQNLERPGALQMDHAAAFKSFIDKLKWFKYLAWKRIDPTKLEYVSAPPTIISVFLF